MSPTTAVNNLVNGSIGNTKSATDGRLARSAGKHTADFANHGLRPLIKRRFFAALSPVMIACLSLKPLNGVPVVLRGSLVVEVAESVIPSITIFMVDLITNGARANKRSGYQNVNAEDTTLADAVKLYFEVARFVSVILQHAPSSAQAPPRFVSAYATKIRDAVQTLIGGNTAPLFGFEFLGGKLLNLRRKVRLWSGSFGVQPSFEPFVLYHDDI